MPRLAAMTPWICRVRLLASMTAGCEIDWHEDVTDWLRERKRATTSGGRAPGGLARLAETAGLRTWVRSDGRVVACGRQATGSVLPCPLRRLASKMAAGSARRTTKGLVQCFRRVTGPVRFRAASLLPGRAIA